MAIAIGLAAGFSPKARENDDGEANGYFLAMDERSRLSIFLDNKKQIAAIAIGLATGFPLKARENDDGEANGYFLAME
ncbi:MAG: hypothetical protein K0R08_420 [Solimicrobium sp.]|nr:hypothetical protein [Solimicrobium sp.]